MSNIQLPRYIPRSRLDVCAFMAGLAFGRDAVLYEAYRTELLTILVQREPATARVIYGS